MEKRNWWNNDSTSYPNCGLELFWAGAESAASLAVQNDTVSFGTGKSIDITNTDGAYWREADGTTAGDGGVCYNIHDDTDASSAGRRLLVKNCCLNSSEVEHFVTCMNFASAYQVNIATENFLAYLYTTVNSDSTATTAVKITDCQNALKKGLYILDADQVDSFYQMCANDSRRNEFITKLSQDSVSTTAMTRTDFLSGYANFWELDTDTDNNFANWYAMTADNLYGNENACKNTFTKGSSSHCVKGYQPAGNVQH